MEGLGGTQWDSSCPWFPDVVARAAAPSQWLLARERTRQSRSGEVDEDRACGSRKMEADDVVTSETSTRTSEPSNSKVMGRVVQHRFVGRRRRVGRKEEAEQQHQVKEVTVSARLCQGLQSAVR